MHASATAFEPRCACFRRGVGHADWPQARERARWESLSSQRGMVASAALNHHVHDASIRSEFGIVNTRMMLQARVEFRAYDRGSGTRGNVSPHRVLTQLGKYFHGIRTQRTCSNNCSLSCSVNVAANLVEFGLLCGKLPGDS